MRRIKYFFTIFFVAFAACSFLSIPALAVPESTINWDIVDKGKVYEQLEIILNGSKDAAYANVDYVDNKFDYEDENGKNVKGANNEFVIRVLKTIDRGVIVPDDIYGQIRGSNSNKKFRTQSLDGLGEVGLEGDSPVITGEYIEIGYYGDAAKALLREYYNYKIISNVGTNPNSTSIVPIIILMCLLVLACAGMVFILFWGKNKEKELNTEKNKNKELKSKDEKITSLQTKIYGLEREKEKAESDHKRLSTEYNNLKEDHNSFTKEKEELCRKNEELRERISTIECSRNAIDKQMDNEPQEQMAQSEEPKEAEKKPCNLNPVSGGVEIVQGNLMLAQKREEDTVYVYASPLASKPAVRNAISSYFQFSVVNKDGAVHTVQPCILKRNVYNYSIEKMGFVEIK